MIDQETDLSIVNGMVSPQAVPIEEVVLGALLQDREAVQTAISMLQGDDFYKPQHEIIYSAIVELYLKSSAIDILTVNEQLSVNGLAEQVPVTYLVELTTKVASAAHLESHCKILLEKSLRRKVNVIATEAIKSVFDNSEDTFALFDTLQLKLGELRSRLTKNATQTLNSIVEETIKEIMSGERGIDLFGIPQLDNILGGAKKGNLIIIAGRPGMGKSFLANTALYNCGIKKNLKVLFWGLEMSNTENMERLMCATGGLDSNLLKEKKISEEILWQTGERIAASNIVMMDNASVSALDVRNKAISMKSKGDLDLIVIDHGGLLNHINPNNKNHTVEIGNTSKLLKQTAKDLGVPIILVWQLSRSVETRGGSKQPVLSDLRDSGRLEEDADKVIFIYRPEYYGVLEIEFDGIVRSSGGLALGTVAKNRNGALGKSIMNFAPRFGKFTSITEGGFPNEEENLPF